MKEILNKILMVVVIGLFSALFTNSGCYSVTMKQVQKSEEDLMQTFYSGVYFHGPYHFNDNIAGMQDEFANFVAHNLNLVLVTNADWGEWGYATTAGNDNGIDVLLGTMNNCLPCCYCITSWSDHASLHSEVQSEILNHINTGASSLLGYYIWDEPTSADASNLGKLQQTLFEEDPVHPGTAILIGQQQMADCYAAMLPRDVMFIDVYPCEAGGLQGNFTNMYQRYEEMIDYIDRARGYIHTLDDTPLWIMLQTQDSTYDNAQSRPTVTEIRAMSWLALAHGAKGLLWFPWHNGQDSWAGLENPSESDEYTEITTISGNMNTMSAELVDLNITTNIASISGGGSEVTVPPTMQDNGFWIISSGATPTVRVDDADASDGKAIRMCNDTTWNTSWDTKWQWGDAGFVTGQNYDLYVRIKVDKNNSSGNAFSYGVWDESSQSQVIQGIVGANSMQDLVYKNIKIGTFIPDKDQYVYIAKTGNLNTPYIYVDKFWFDGSNVKIYDNGDVQTFIADSPFRRVETTHTTGQDSQFNLYNNAVRESDTSASDGYTAKMESSDTSWNLQWTWGNAGFAGGESYDLWVRIKADHTIVNPGGNAFRFGVWDTGSSTEIVPTTPVPANATQDMVYQDIRIGTFTPGANQYVYVSGPNNTDISYIYVDKYWFVGKQTGQDSQFNLYNNAVRESDTSASDGYTAKMESSDTSWNLQWTWGSAGFAGGESYDLWVRIKADHTVANPGGNAFRFGVWDNGSSTEIVPTTPVPASATQDMVYQDIRIGTFTPGVNQYVYVSGANNADISYVYVDKYWFVGKQTAQEAKLDLLGNAVKVTDGDASDGWSAKTQNNHNDWNIRWLWGNGLSFEPGLKYDLYATVKVDHVISGFTLPTGNAFKFGVWDNGSSTEIVPTTPVPVSISKDMVFRTYKIGTFVPETDQYAYIGGTNNAANVSDIYVDKFFFVPRGDNYLIAVNRNVFNSDTVTVSFPKTAVDKYGDGNVTANNVLTGNNITLSGTSTLSFSEILSPGGGIVVRLKSNRVSIP